MARQWPSFKLPVGIVDDPVLSNLTSEQFQDWVNLVALAGIAREPGTIEMSPSELAWRLRRDFREFDESLHAMQDHGLVEINEDCVTVAKPEAGPTGTVGFYVNPTFWKTSEDAVAEWAGSIGSSLLRLFRGRDGEAFTATLLFALALSHADERGIVPGDPQEFRRLVCPELPLTEDEIQAALETIHDTGLWLIEQPNEDSEPLLQFDRELFRRLRGAGSETDQG